jgi:hypothetical protein
MRKSEQQRRADEAALEGYARARTEGASPERAFNVAILRWLGCCRWADGRQARVRVREVLLRNRAMGPRDYEDWVILASGEDVWGAGAPAAIHRLSLDCRTLDMHDADDRHGEYEAAGAEVLRDYLRVELPKKVSRLKQLARDLLPSDTVREDA